MNRALVLLAAFIWLAPLAFSADMAKGASRFDQAQIRPEHPRVWLDAERVKAVRAKAAGKTTAQVLQMTGTSTPGKALAYVMTGDEAPGREAVIEALKAAGDRNAWIVALVYDWCHPILSDADKDTLRKKMVAAGDKVMAFGRGWRSFHNGLYSGAWPLTATAMAIYGEDPAGEKYWTFLKGELEDVLRTFDNLFPDGEWCEGFDYNRHGTYEALKFFWAIKTATGLDVMKDSPHMLNATRFIIYGTKPNGLVIPINDCDWPYVIDLDRPALLLHAAEFADPYSQYYLNHMSAEEFMPAGRNKWLDVLWHNPALAEAPLSELLKSKLFRGMGLVIARSGWAWDTKERRENSTWLAFRCGDYYGDHCHFDQNMFEIYCKAPLALDSGRYDDDWGVVANDAAEMPKSQFYNYYQRTIAHNTVLVYDPSETFTAAIVNDGGQRHLLLDDEGDRAVPEDYDQSTFPSGRGRVGAYDWATNPDRWETGDIRVYKATPDFMYVCGDATAAYSSAKLKSYVRQLVFAYPDVIVIFDRVVSTKPEFKKTWLLHSVNEATVAEDLSSYVITNGNGRLVCIPVLPAARNVMKIGLPNDAFLVNGKEFRFGPSSLVTPSPLHYAQGLSGEQIGETPGKWRIEESPADAATEDYFLHVLVTGDAASEDMPAVTPAINDRTAQVKVALKDGCAVTATFVKGDRSSLKLRIEKGGKVSFEAEVPQTVESEK